MNAGQEFLMSKFASSADLHAAMVHEICRLRDELAARSTPMAGAEPPKQGEARFTPDLVEERLNTWRQRLMNKSGDRLALDDFMGQESIDDLIDFVCAPSPSVEPAQCVAEDDADEIMHKVGELVGMSHGAWDMVSARGLVAAFKKVLAPAPHQEPGWQPIETAPKDGRELILLLTPSRFPQVAYSNTWWTAGFSVECKPTHWMPLPPAPERPKP